MADRFMSAHISRYFIAFLLADFDVQLYHEATIKRHIERSNLCWYANILMFPYLF